MDERGYCRFGYYRGNCKAKNKPASEKKRSEDNIACANVNSCFAQCAKEEQCKFAAFQKGKCSRYDSRAGECSGKNYVKDRTYQLFRKE
jgi:hypothetical protein